LVDVHSTKLDTYSRDISGNLPERIGLSKECIMASDEDEDLYDEEFDFVDDDDEEFDEGSDVEGETAAGDRGTNERASNNRAPREERADQDDRDGVDDEPVDEYGRTPPKADYVVHIYEYEKFKRTIDRPFTPEDAESFATEYNRTAKPYGRLAVTGKNDAKPKKTLD
jgi:hypothetical protein